MGHDDPARPNGGHLDAGPVASSAEVERLLALVDDQLRRASLLDPLGRSVPPLPLPPAPMPAPDAFSSAEALADLEAPLFNVARGSTMARLLRRALNLPLRLFAVPQRYWNGAVRQLARTWAGLLRTMVDFEALLRIEVIAQREEIRRLERDVARLDGALTALLGSGAPVGRIEVEGVGGRARVMLAPAAGAGVGVVGDPGRLPFGPGSLAGLRVPDSLDVRAPAVLEHLVLPQWLGTLCAGGTLRVVAGQDATPALCALLARAGFTGVEVVGSSTAGPSAVVEVVARRPAGR